jgi:hypothetical protein
MAIGLPIKMVVITIVGMVGLAAMLTIMNSSQDAVPRPMHADLKNMNLIILSDLSEKDDIDLLIEVLNSRDGTPVKKASVALMGHNASSINMTDHKGETLLKFYKNDFNMAANEGYLRLHVRATGFQDYINEYAVKIVK